MGSAIKKFFSENISWHLLRGFGQSKAAGLTILTPFVGYVILYHSQIKPYLGGLGGLLDTQASCTDPIPFMAKLHLVYLGLLFLGIGTLLYRIFCPNFIKSFNDISDFTNQEKDTLSARKMRSMFLEIVKTQPELKDEFIGRCPWLDADKVALKSASDSFAKNKEHSIRLDILRSYYVSANLHTSRKMACVITMFFVAGFILLSIPSLIFTFRVLCALF